MLWNSTDYQKTMHRTSISFVPAVRVIRSWHNFKKSCWFPHFQHLTALTPCCLTSFESLIFLSASCRANFWCLRKSKEKNEYYDGYSSTSFLFFQAVFHVQYKFLGFCLRSRRREPHPSQGWRFGLKKADENSTVIDGSQLFCALSCLLVARTLINK